MTFCPALVLFFGALFSVNSYAMPKYSSDFYFSFMKTMPDYAIITFPGKKKAPANQSFSIQKYVIIFFFSPCVSRICS